MDKFYITTTLPYINSDPHIGFALEAVQADTIARRQKLLGKEVFFNVGTDEHGLKIFRTAQEKGMDVKTYCDKLAERWKDLKKALNLSYTNFIRTTDEHHIMAAQEFWRRCLLNGDIYKKNYKIKYCVGCELEKTESELVDGQCEFHPNLELETIEEENYFFRFSKYQEALLELYKNGDFIVPGRRLNEIKNFVEKGLEDFSISRLKSKMPWGVPVPDDENHVMYVWFDALVNYVSAIGYPDEMEKMNSWWPGVQIAGKDNLRQQSAMWQAMLMSAKFPPTKQIIIHGFITSGGQKMSKSLGNVADPFDLVQRYGTDALRYYFLREVSPFEDSDFTEERFKSVYNANLANGLGNLVSRIMKMSEEYIGQSFAFDKTPGEESVKFSGFMDKYEFNKAMDMAWGLIGELDAYIQKNQPFKVFKENPDEARVMVRYLVSGLYQVAEMLQSAMPETAEKILACIEANKMPAPIFLRKE